jgi:hypothetical protein
MTPEVLDAIATFVSTVGGPLAVTAAVLFLLWKQLGVAAKQTELLFLLSGHVAETSERTESNGGKLDAILSKLERGVCRESHSEVDQVVHRDEDYQRDRRTGYAGS